MFMFYQSISQSISKFVKPQRLKFSEAQSKSHVLRPSFMAGVIILLMRDMTSVTSVSVALVVFMSCIVVSGLTNQTVIFIT